MFQRRSETIMSAFHFGEIEVVLEATENASGVSFAGKSLKLDGEEDVQDLVRAIEECRRLEYLDLEGNTLGTEAARALAKALEFHGSHLKRALWKDMFTGRMKDEIPVALSHLGAGLRVAGTNLVELDLSDNAFGPIGVQGLAELLSSSTCYTLETLRLNNNGLGITGGKMLARALLDCHEESSKQGGKPLALKVFVAGRNRLENEGAIALAAVFQKLATLEEVVMPQNGIYHVGIAALARGLSVNPNLRMLNLNDNTIGFKGAEALAKALPNFPKLEVLNLGDCLLKTKGAMVLAEALCGRESHVALAELNLSSNEIHARGINSIVEAVEYKTMLNSLQLDGNAFGNEGRNLLRESLASFAKIDSLGSLEEDESECESEEEDEDEEEEEEEEDDEEEEEEEEEDEEEESANGNEFKESIQGGKKETRKSITVEQFLESPNGENLLLIHGDKVKGFVNHAKNQSLSEDTPTDCKYTEVLSRITMVVSSLSESGYLDVRAEAEKLSDSLYSELFSHATKNNRISTLNNALLVHLGLIKSEGKSRGKIDGNLEGCFKILEKISAKEYFLRQTKDTLKVFLQKPERISRAKIVDPLQGAKDSLKSALDRSPNT